MSDTKDKAATAPLLSDWEIEKRWPGHSGEQLRDGMTEARDFYEDLIASGELMTRKTTKFEHRDSFVHCEVCGWNMAWEAEGLCDKFKSCPGCSAKITEG